MPFIEPYEKDLIENFRFIAGVLTDLAKIRLLDQHKHAEAFIADLLNEFCGKNLEVMKPGQQGVDLYDREEAVTYQVTTQNTRLKILRTIDGLNKAILAGEVSAGVTLYLLMLTCGPVEIIKPQDEVNIPFVFKQAQVINLPVISDMLVAVIRKNPEKGDLISDFMVRRIRILKDLERLHARTEPKFIPASHYITATENLPVYPGNYWGLNRGSFTGIYLSGANSNGALIKELNLVEYFLSEEAAGTGFDLPIRNWLDIHGEANPDPESALRRKAKEGYQLPAGLEAPPVGLLVSYRLPAGGSLLQLFAGIKAWCQLAQRLRLSEQYRQLALIFDIGLDYEPALHFSQLKEMTLQLQPFCRFWEFTAIYLPWDLKAASAISGSLFKLHFSSRESSQKELKSLYFLICKIGHDLSAQGTGLASFFNRAPLIKEICLQDGDLFEECEAVSPDHIPATDWGLLLHLLKRCCRDDRHFADLHQELLGVVFLTKNKQIGCAALHQYARAPELKLQQLALMFALKRGAVELLDAWMDGILFHENICYVRLMENDRARLMLALLRRLNSDDFSAEPFRGRAKSMLNHYAAELPTNHFLRTLFMLYAGPAAIGAPGYDTLLRRMSYRQVSQFLESGLYRRFHFTLTDVLSKIALASYPGYFWKTLFFNQTINSENVRQIIKANFNARCVAGLCSPEEFGAPAYAKRIELIRECREVTLE